MLPHTDPDFKTPMQGLTRSTYDTVQSAIRRYRERWLSLMDVWERAQEKIDSEWSLGTSSADEAVKLLDSAEARPPLDAVAGARVLDLFAGTGAMGIEALSRGAASCSFVENDRGALAVLRNNIDTLGLGDRATVVAADAHSACRGTWDVVIADPPYAETDWSGLLDGLRCSIAVVESGRPIGPVPGWETLREKRYGRTHVAFLRPAAPVEGTVESE